MSSSLTQTPPAALPGARALPQDAFSRRNALRRLVRCLFAEKILDESALTFNPQGRGACIALWSRHAFLFFDDLHVGPARTLLNRGEITLVEADGRRTPVEEPAQLLDLLLDRFDFTPAAQAVDGLKKDVANSIANDALARDYRRAWNAHLDMLARSSGAGGLLAYLRSHASTQDAAMLLDQWGSLEGHPFYPTWKSKPDLNPSQVVELSPEFNARVRVRIGALRSDMAYIERMPHVHDYRAWFAQTYPQVWSDWEDALRAKGLDASLFLPLPIHAWHLENFVGREYAAEIADGALPVVEPARDRRGLGPTVGPVGDQHRPVP